MNCTPRTFEKFTRVRSGPRQLLEERDRSRVPLEMLQTRTHVDRLDTAASCGAVRRTVLDAHAAAGAVLDIDLERVARLGIAARVDRHGLESRRRVFEPRAVVVLRADDAVRADDGALAALDAEIGLPDGHFLGDVALLVLRRAGGESAVDRACALTGKRFAEPGHHDGRHLAHELGRAVRHLSTTPRWPVCGAPGPSLRADSRAHCRWRRNSCFTTSAPLRS